MRTVKTILAAMLMVLDLSLAFVGIILMICESDDPHMQTVTLVSGFVMFTIACIPALIAGIKNKNEEEGRYIK